MSKIVSKIKPLIFMLLCIAVCVAFLCMAFKGAEKEIAEEKAVIHIWQIDNFEGGKGSRADYLQKIGNDFTDKSGNYVSVVALSADAARMNLADGNFPDIISYGAGISGIESYISSYRNWCYGGYCFLTLDGNADFSDINNDNTIVNEGKDNLVDAAALFYGLQNATFEKSTGAYVKLINGAYKYLLGTQRDIFRLKTRGVSFTVKPITEFNDLFQNISVIINSKNDKLAQNFIEYLLTRSDEVVKLGLMSEATVFDDEMSVMSNLNYEYRLTAPVSEQTKNQLKNIIADGDINMLKNLLK